jgi:hypothetical protein
LDDVIVSMGVAFAARFPIVDPVGYLIGIVLLIAAELVSTEP